MQKTIFNCKHFCKNESSLNKLLVMRSNTFRYQVVLCRFDCFYLESVFIPSLYYQYFWDHSKSMYDKTTSYAILNVLIR